MKLNLIKENPQKQKFGKSDEFKIFPLILNKIWNFKGKIDKLMDVKPLIDYYAKTIFFSWSQQVMEKRMIISSVLSLFLISLLYYQKQILALSV